MCLTLTLNFLFQTLYREAIADARMKGLQASSAAERTLLDGMREERSNAQVETFAVSLRS